MVNRTPFSEIFGQVMDCAALGDEIRDVAVSDIRIFREERALTLALVLTRVVSYVWYRRLLDAVSRALDLRRLDCRLTFDGLPLDEAGVAFAIADLTRDNAAIGGIFNGCALQISGDSVTLKLQHGGVSAGDAPDARLARLLSDLYGKPVTVALTGELEATEVVVPEEVLEAAHKEKEPEPTDPPADGLPIYLDTAKVVWSRYGGAARIKGDLVPISSLTPDLGTCTIWGEVFKTEVKPTRSGDRVRLNISLTDYTDSIMVR